MTDSPDPFQGLKASKDALEAGLALLDGSAAVGLDQDDAAHVAAWANVMEAIASAPQPDSLRAAVPESRLADFDGELEELIRLNAVLAAAIELEKGDLMGKLKAVRETRRDLSFYGATEPQGDRCDISG